ncbi:sperm adhesion molecule 1 [Reticulomyxa filosa]|uniref:Sperm adhesion molecule 1 n=1 Tax=Reticulomyxa filosa TaxID=46433 RepID=X6P8P0_RETFI|nr:sperm adhesion molecule 1 [Reticulomyxa filosa]|eukprot:ETO34478.1 sperm adhesion molecule 1 [Reticulomyxa filosa]
MKKGNINKYNSFWQQEMEISIVGLQGAGKSTFIQVLQVKTIKGEFVPNMIPTVGFNMHKVEKGKVQIKGDKRNFDQCGKDIVEKMTRLCKEKTTLLIQTTQQIFSNYFTMFMVDAADPKKFQQASKELRQLLALPSLEKIPLLLLFNKKDLPEARSADEIVETLDLKGLGEREIGYYEISCKEVINIDNTLDWLIKHTK